MKNKIILTIFLGMFLLVALPLVSAEKISYSNEDLDVTLSEGAFFNLFKGEEIGTLELKSHPSVNYVLPATRGNQITMFYDFNFQRDYVEGLKKPQFFDMKTGEEVERAWRFVYFEEGVCNEIKFENGTKDKQCSKGKWKDYNSENIPKGKIRIGIEVEVKRGDWIDGVWNVAGKKIDKHASWIELGVESHAISAGGADITDLTMTLYNNVSQGFVKAIGLQLGDGSDIDWQIHVNQSGTNLTYANLSATSNDGTTYYYNFTSAEYSDALESGEFTIDIHKIRGSSLGFQRGQHHNFSGSLFSFYDEIAPFTSAGVFITFGEVTTTALNITLLSPDDNTNFTSSLINLSANASLLDPNLFQLENVTINVYNSTNTNIFNETNSSGVEGFYNFSNTFIDGTYEWNITAFNNESGKRESETRVFEIDTTAPGIDVSFPNETITFQEKNTNLSVNWTVTETNPDVCMFEWNGVNTTVTCSDTSTSFNITDGTIKQLTFYANDTFGNSNSSTVTWDYRLFLNNQSFQESIVEGSETTFTANFITNGSTITIANLSYNLTQNLGIISNHGDNNFTVKNTIEPPAVNSDTNISFFWDITQNGFNFALTGRNQTITNLEIDDCDSFSNRIFNFTIYDEENPSTQLDNTTTKYAFNVTGSSKTKSIATFNKTTSANSFSICFNNNINNNLSLDGTVEHTANDSNTDFRLRRYNFLNTLISNSTIPQSIDLYGINSSESLPFVLTFRNSQQALGSNILVQVHKQFLETNDFKIVEIPLTDTNGQTILNLVRNDAVYNLIMVDESRQVVASFNNIVAFCQDFTIQSCSIDLSAPGTGDTSYNFDEEIGISYSLSYSNSSKLISLSFNSINGSNKNVNLIVTTPNQFENRSVCNTNLNSASGTLTCDISDFVDTNQFFYQEIRSDGLYVETELLNANENLPSTGTAFGASGFIFALLILLFITLLFSDDRQVLVISLGLGWVLVTALGLIRGTLLGLGSGGIWLFITIIIFIWKLKGEES